MVPPKPTFEISLGTQEEGKMSSKTLQVEEYKFTKKKENRILTPTANPGFVFPE